MRRPLITSAFAAGLLTLGACATLGEPVVLTMADMEQRCERRGGMLQPTGAATGRPQSDYVCREAMAGLGVNRQAARTSLNTAITNSLTRGY